MGLTKIFRSLQAMMARDFTEFSLHLVITVWALGIALFNWFIHNPWILGGMFAYEVLP